MAKPIKDMTYTELREAVDKAERLPEEVRQNHLRRYIDLCLALGEKELAENKFPAHAICDPKTRDIVHKLLLDIRALLRGSDIRDASNAVLTDLLALASTPDERVLEIFGYRPADDD